MSTTTGGAFETKAYDVTGFCAAYMCCGIFGKKMLVLDEEEAVLRYDGLIYNTVANRPYGSLGTVERENVCCFIGFTSNLSTDDGKLAAIVPGNCCETALVDEIVRELKMRMKGRGDTGQVQMTEATMEEIKVLHAKVDALMAHLSVPAVTASDAISR